MDRRNSSVEYKFSLTDALLDLNAGRRWFRSILGREGDFCLSYVPDPESLDGGESPLRRVSPQASPSTTASAGSVVEERISLSPPFVPHACSSQKRKRDHDGEETVDGMSGLRAQGKRKLGVYHRNAEPSSNRGEVSSFLSPEARSPEPTPPPHIDLRKLYPARRCGCRSSGASGSNVDFTSDLAVSRLRIGQLPSPRVAVAPEDREAIHYLGVCAALADVAGRFGVREEAVWCVWQKLGSVRRTEEYWRGYRWKGGGDGVQTFRDVSESRAVGLDQGHGQACRAGVHTDTDVKEEEDDEGEKIHRLRVMLADEIPCEDGCGRETSRVAGYAATRGCRHHDALDGSASG